MLLITCPCCGVEGEETEFSCGGEAHIIRPGPECTDQEWSAYLFDRKNPRGNHLERWRHAFGCGKWFHMARNTQTLEILGTYAADETTPPAHIISFLENGKSA